MSQLTQDVLREMDRLIASAGHEIPAATPSRGETDLTVAFAVYDDFDGAFFTLHSLMLHHPEVMDRTELLILDNHPEGLGAPQLAAYAKSTRRNIRYVPYTERRSTAVRDVIFQEAAGKVVVVLDCHVLLQAGALAAILRYYDEHPDSLDLLQGPMLSGDATHIAATQMDPQWRKGMFGKWGTDERANDIDGEPFDIPSHGLAAFACRRDAWPGLNPLFQGFGGEEGYLHEKFRQAGGRTLCLPAFRWVHRFDRPRGAPYPNNWVDRIHNYLVGWAEIGYDLDSIRDQFSSLFPPGYYNPTYAEAERMVQAPGRAFGGIAVTSDPLRIAPWRAALAEAKAAELKVDRVTLSVPEGADHGDPLTAGIRRAVAMAAYRRWPSVLIVDESSTLDGGLPYRVSGAVAGTSADLIAVVDSDGHRGAVVIRSGAYADILAVESLADLEALGAVSVTTVHPVAPARTTQPPVLRVPHLRVLNNTGATLPAGRAQDFAQAFQASVSERTAYLDQTHPARGHAKSLRHFINELVEFHDDEVTVMVPSQTLLHDSTVEIVTRAVLEAEAVGADILVLGAAEADQLDPVDTLVQLRQPGGHYPDSALVILPGAPGKLAGLIPDPLEDGPAFDAWLAVNGSVGNFLRTTTELKVFPVWPAVAATADTLRTDSSHARRSQLFRSV